MFTLYLLFLAIPILLFWLYQKQEEEDAKIGVPGPKGWPLLGVIFEIRPFLKTRTVFKIIHDYHIKYGDTYQFRLGPIKRIVSRDPKIIEAIVNNQKFEKAGEYNIVKPIVGNCLAVAEYEKWHIMRKLLTPAFHFQILERFIPIFEEQVGVMIENVRKEIETPIDVSPKFHLLALDIISETSMGVQLNAQSDLYSPFVEACETILDIVGKRIFSGYLTVDWIFRLSPLYKINNEKIALINIFVDKVVKERREKLLKENKLKQENQKESESKQRPAFLDILLEAQIDGKPLSNEDIKFEVKNLMIAGHETTGNTLSFIVYLIAKHPHVQEKLWNEIKSNCIDCKTENLTIRILNSLSYLDNVIKETLRLYPPLIWAAKSCSEDSQIGDLFIPANTPISASMYSGHRMEQYFKNPEEFIPERFDNEITAEDRNPYVYQPFSAGLRNCIGQRFAMLEMKTVLVKLLSAFHLALIDEDFEINLIAPGLMKSENGVIIKFKERN